METEKQTMKRKGNHGRFRVAVLLLTDIITLYGILALVLFIYKCFGGEYDLMILLDLWLLPVAVVLCNIFSRLYCGSLLYPGAGCSAIEELKRLTLSILGGYILLFAYLSITRSSGNYTRLGLLVSMGFSVLLLPIIRYGVRSAMKHFRCGDIPVLIAGAGLTGCILGEELKKDKFFGFRIAGYLDDSPEKQNIPLPGGTVLGPLDSAQEIAHREGVDYLISTLPLPAVGKRLNDWLAVFQHVMVIPDNRVFPILWAHPVDLYGLGAIEVGNRLKRPIFRFGKILCETLIAVFAILFLLPFCLMLALLVKLTSRGPILYRAKRMGANGSRIEVWKFRTMYADADRKLEQMLAENPEMEKEWREKFKLDKDPRITPLGAFLRKTSLDELPQFLNVIRGEMAVIGPRPIVEKEIEYYGPHYEVFSRVKPGITGLWQVSGRSETTYERRIALDMYYINNWSIWLDYYIFLKTVKEVFSCHGAK